MYYGDRLALITNIHRKYDEFLETLKENDEEIHMIGTSGYYKKKV
jgi:hypothetical protein